MGVASGKKFVVKIETQENMTPDDVARLVQGSICDSGTPLAGSVVVSAAAVDDWPLLNNCTDTKCLNF